MHAFFKMIKPIMNKVEYYPFIGLQVGGCGCECFMYEVCVCTAKLMEIQLYADKYYKCLISESGEAYS